MGLRTNIAVLKNAAEAIGAALQSQKQYHQPTLFLMGKLQLYQSQDRYRDFTIFPKAEIVEIKGAWALAPCRTATTFFKTFDSVVGIGFPIFIFSYT